MITIEIPTNITGNLSLPPNTTLVVGSPYATICALSCPFQIIITTTLDTPCILIASSEVSSSVFVSLILSCSSVVLQGDLSIDAGSIISLANSSSGIEINGNFIVQSGEIVLGGSTLGGSPINVHGCVDFQDASFTIDFSNQTIPNGEVTVRPLNLTLSLPVFFAHLFSVHTCVSK